MNRSRSSLRAISLAAFGAVALTACQDAAPTSPVEASAVELSMVPRNPSKNTSTVDATATEPEYIKVCVRTEREREIAPVRVEAAVDKGADGKWDGPPVVVNVENGRCKDVWLHGGLTYDRIRLDMAKVEGFEPSLQRTSVTRTKHGDPATDVFTTDAERAGNSESGLVRGDAGARVVFTLREPSL